MADSPPRRPGPIYDDAIRILVDDDLGSFLDVVMIFEHPERLNPGLPASTMNADLVVRTDRAIAHIEFVKDPTPDLGLRMVDYRIRLRRRHRGVPITQHILVLGDGRGVPDHFTDGPLHCTWTVTRIADLDPADLLRHPTTAALAALAGDTPEQRRALLVAAAERIAAETDTERGMRLLGAATTLAAIVLPPSTINSAMKEAAMTLDIRDTPFGEFLIERYRDEVREEGREEGRSESRREIEQLTAVLLRQRFGDDPRIPDLAIELMELISEDRLHRISTATSLSDLERR